jgi:hypothetical protein
MKYVSTRFKVILGFISVTVLLLVPILLSDALVNEYDRTDIAQIAAEETIKNCEEDHEARVLYRERAIAEKRHLRLEARSNRYIAIILGQSLRNPDPNEHATHAQIKFARKATRTFHRTAQIEHRIANSLEIVPVRNCKELRKDIESAR